MKGLYFDCSMGAAGDMIMASLLSVYEDKQGFIRFMNSLGLAGVSVEYDEVEKCGIAGIGINVAINGKNEEGLSDISSPVRYAVEIEGIIDNLPLSEKVKKDAIGIFALLFEAESKVHNQKIDNIHLHEVGSLDAICDITGVCWLIDKLGIERVDASAVNVGGGSVKCAHGVLPVPAPATAEILKGVPVYSSGINSELCTPTGAAILKYYCEAFTPLPLMRPSSIGYGMGKKDFERANCIRAFVYEKSGAAYEEITEINANIDDMTPEELAYAVQKMLDAGALDAFITPVVMKKGRPAHMLTCLCENDKTDEFVKIIFENTSSIGMRMTKLGRAVLDRQVKTVRTDLGEVRYKRSAGFGVEKIKPEFDDLREIAAKNNISLPQARRYVMKLIDEKE